MTRSRTLTDTMLIAGTQALASLSPAHKDPDLALLPDFQDSRDANFAVAVAVAENAMPRVDATPGGADEELTQAAEVVPTRRS